MVVLGLLVLRTGHPRRLIHRRRRRHATGRCRRTTLPSASRIRNFASWPTISARQHPGVDPMLAEIAKLQPDYVLLQGVNEDDSIEIAESLGMQHSFHPQLYQRSEHLAGRRGIWGKSHILSAERRCTPKGAPPRRKSWRRIRRAVPSRSSMTVHFSSRIFICRRAMRAPARLRNFREFGRKEDLRRWWWPSSRPMPGRPPGWIFCRVFRRQAGNGGM